MSTPYDRLHELYAAALRESVRGGGEGGLSRAYQLGREALAAGLGILDVATIHNSARARLGSEDADDAEQAFFAEALSPFEMVHRSTSETNAALRRANDNLEREVRRMAHALHDDIGALLFSVHLSLHALAEELPASAQLRVREVKARLDQVEHELRRLSHELRPMILEDLGLAAALRHLADGVGMRAGIPVSVACSDLAGMSSTAQAALYRIVQQALVNVSKHARATRAWVDVTVESGSVRCTVADDGVGFTVGAPVEGANVERGLGLVGMRERTVALGGAFEVSSAPDEGTRILITIPSEA